MKTCDFFSACAEDLKKAVDPKNNESMIMIGAFPKDDKFCIMISGVGLDLTAALCAAFESDKNFKKLAMLALETIRSQEFINSLKEN